MALGLALQAYCSLPFALISLLRATSQMPSLTLALVINKQVNGKPPPEPEPDPRQHQAREAGSNHRKNQEYNINI